MSVKLLATSVPSEPENFAGISGFYPIDRTSVGVLLKMYDNFQFFIEVIVGLMKFPPKLILI